MPLTQVQPGLLDQYSQYTGFKNRIINGAMLIDQRNSFASVTLANNSRSYAADRFSSARNNWTTLTASVQCVAEAPAGFSCSYKVTVGTAEASAPAAAIFVGADHRIEGFNAIDFNFGTASAQSFTLSFWVRASVAGAYPVSFFNAAVSRGYVTTYTVNSANTWEFKTITVQGDTAGTWNTGNGIGLGIQWDVGSGSNLNGTANTWSGTYASRVAGCVNLNATAGATWQITGVQLEEGVNATQFDYRPYGKELMLSQRYYWRRGGATNITFGTGTVITATTSFVHLQFPVAMRAGPTISQANTYVYEPLSSTVSSFGTIYTNPGNDSAGVNLNHSSGLTTGRGAVWLSSSSAGYVDASAEL